MSSMSKSSKRSKSTKPSKPLKLSKSSDSPDAASDTESSKRMFSVYNKREFLSALMLTNCNPNKELIVMARFRATDDKRESVKGKLDIDVLIFNEFQ